MLGLLPLRNLPPPTQVHLTLLLSLFIALILALTLAYP